MYFQGLLIDNTVFFIDEKKGRPCFSGISTEIVTLPLVYLPEKE
jgi:hypothetical protein